ncbi:hypothetical protein I302_100507 [Kwoniella bestiolae CBS 10118]|uniref:PUB domain-containing protein n=1 Tax=Kwoniella bestiolae CBS 10118 TaxID=1296100 RepID=A0A1B9G5B6_9TREE|nr:hypothetical protein I302_03880 [Kwoniella bestiolae CBS 10118]OCF26201.1 hypothetical protein I302_03880 [Kwoniella bestiolae CBS 10118]
MASPSTSSNPAERRAAALAAIEARQRPPPSYDEIQAEPSTSDQGASSSSSAPSHSSAPQPTSVIPTAATRPLRQNPAAQAAQARAEASASLSRQSSDTAWRPSEKEDRETRIKFSRLLDRGIVRDNSYKDSADAVETLIKISNNIIDSNDPKYRTIKATNSTIKNKVLDVKGGHDYLIALGFRTQTVEFTLHYVFSSTLKKMHELKIGAEVLSDHLKALQERVELSRQSKIYGASVEASRKKAALADIEADREVVRARAAREKIVREAREAREREEKEREAQSQAEMVVDREDEERREMRDAVVRPLSHPDGVDDDDDEEEEDRELPSYAEDRESRGWGGPGRRLGG